MHPATTSTRRVLHEDYDETAVVHVSCIKDTRHRSSKPQSIPAILLVPALREWIPTSEPTTKRVLQHV